MSNFYKNKDYHIIGSRCCGKTTSLIINAELRNIHYILTESSDAVKLGNLLVEAMGYKDKNIKFVPYDEAIKIDEDFLIDDIDKFLHSQYQGFRGFSMSTKEY